VVDRADPHVNDVDFASRCAQGGEAAVSTEPQTGLFQRPWWVESGSLSQAGKQTFRPSVEGAGAYCSLVTGRMADREILPVPKQQWDQIRVRANLARATPGSFDCSTQHIAVRRSKHWSLFQQD
jgi:hypothetical protein